MQAKPLLDSDDVEQLTDPRLKDTYDLREMERVITTASMCIHYLADMRPDMNRVRRLSSTHVAIRETFSFSTD